MASPELYAELLVHLAAAVKIAGIIVGGAIIAAAVAGWDRHRRQLARSRRDRR